jgi:type II secretory pathway predicted ATPase ExeA
MYETHFGFHRRPFRSTPDSEYYYPATTHEQALARLLEAIAADEGVMLLTGEPGTGKTLLCHRLLERLGAETTSVFLTHSHFSGRAGLLQAILYDLGLPYEGRGEQELRLALVDFLLKNYGGGRRAVLVLDEAHHLTPDLLEELRLVGNLEGREGKAVQVVLVGQARLQETLRRPQLASLSQRLVVRVRLNALDVHESADYLVSQIRAVGGRPEEIVSDEALEALTQAARGLPRLLNQAAHQALALAQAAGVASVDAEVALEALSALGLDPETGAAAGLGLPVLPGSEAAGEEVLPLTGTVGDDSVANGNAADEPTPRWFGTPRRPA